MPNAACHRRGESRSSCRRTSFAFRHALLLGLMFMLGVVPAISASGDNVALAATKSVLAAAPAAPVDSEAIDGALELTLSEAIRLAFEYDLDHEIARLNWENARIDNLIARASGPVSAYEQLQRDLQERRAENAYVTSRKSLVQAVVQEYFEVQQAERQVDIARRQADIAARELDVVRQMVQIGERHPQDELRERNRVASAELNAETAARTFQSRLAALRQRLGLAETVELVLVDEPEAIPFDWSLDETLAYALENNFSVWERDMNVRIARMDLEALRVQDPAPLQLEKAENNLRVTELTALQGERTFYINVVGAYYGLTDAARRLESARVEYDLALAAFDVARRQYEAGLITEIDWERAHLERETAVQSYLDSVTTYVRARLDLLNLIGHPLELDEEFAAR